MRRRIYGFFACCICAAALLFLPEGAYAEGGAAASGDSSESINIQWDEPLFTFECDKQWDASAHRYIIAERQRQSNVSTMRVSRRGDDSCALSVVLRFSPAFDNCFEASFFSDDLSLAYTGTENEVKFELPAGGAGSIDIRLFYIGNEEYQESLMGQVGSIQTTVTPIASEHAEVEEEKEEVDLSPETAFIPDAVNGRFYNAQLIADAEKAGSWQISGGRLPKGLWLQQGAIIGVPQDMPGVYSVSISDGEASSPVHICQFTLTEREKAECILTETMTAAALGEDYSFQFDCVHPVSSWSMAYGKLPEGLTLSAEGQISGVPLETGLFVFSLVESNGISADIITEKRLFIAEDTARLDLEPAAVSEDIQPETLLPDGMLNLEYDFVLTPKLDTTPIWSLSSALPDGLSFFENGIYGIPAIAGEYTVELELRIGDFLTAKSVVLSVEEQSAEPTPTADPTSTVEPTNTVEPAPTAETESATEPTVTAPPEEPAFTAAEPSPPSVPTSEPKVSPSPEPADTK